MPKYNFTPRKLIKILKKNGFVFTRQNGSHAIYRNDLSKRKITVPIHNKDIPTGTLHAIIKDAGLEL